MKVLRYENRKTDPWYLDASTPEKEVAALKCLFLHLKDSWHCYNDMIHIHYEIAQTEKELDGLRELKEQLPTIPKMLRQDAEKKIEESKKVERHLADLKWRKEEWDKVLAGDVKALKGFLGSRSKYEYEEWEFIEVDDPIEHLKKHMEKVKEDYA